MSGDGKKSIHIDIGRHLPFFPLSTVRNSTMKVWYKVRHTEVWVPTRLFYSQGSKSIHRAMQLLTRAIPWVSFIYFSECYHGNRYVCDALTEKQLHGVLVHASKCALDDRQQTSHNKAWEEDRHIPLAYYEECCIALISESITFFSMYQLWLATEWDSLTCICLHMITMIFNVSYFYINIFSSQSMLAMKKWITMNE